MIPLLVTGFEPFGSFKLNSSLLLLKALQERQIGDTLLLKTTYNDCETQLFRSLQRTPPRILIMTGLAAGIPKLHLERFAVNLNDSEKADNAGDIRINQMIQPSFPLAYPSSLPLPAILKALKEAHIPAVLSNSAGTYVCNHVFYQTQHFIQTQNLPTLAVFYTSPVLPSRSVKKI
jgi:pyroglutamyl-peptidase